MQSVIPSFVSFKRQRGWLHFLIPAGCWPKEFARQRANGLADHIGLRYVCKL